MIHEACLKLHVVFFLNKETRYCRFASPDIVPSHLVCRQWNIAWYTVPLIKSLIIVCTNLNDISQSIWTHTMWGASKTISKPVSAVQRIARLKAKYLKRLIRLASCIFCVSLYPQEVQSTLVISTSVISNNCLSRRKNLVLVITHKSKIRL